MLALLSDIHANLPALEAVLDVVKERGPDKIVCLGDIIGYGPFPNECLKLVKKYCDIILLGNHEVGFLEKNLSWFNIYAQVTLLWTKEKLKKEYISFLGTLPISKRDGFYAFHGWENNPFKYVFDYELEGMDLSPIGEDFIFYGHTHIPLIKSIDGKIIINPGSVGQPRDYNPKASFAMVDMERKKGEIIRVDYDIDAVAEKMKEENFPGFLWERLYQGI